ncbi:MAG: LamG domain-containing protein [Gammaproteobacteria bacterium]|nr:LamG domain-containing protein [Gammaproteobacteria bacterium]
MDTKLSMSGDATHTALRSWSAGVCLAAAALLLGACGGPGGSAPSSETPLALATDQAAFESTVYKVTTQYCAGCHDGNTAGAPAFANKDSQTAYKSILDGKKVDKLNPAKSRIVVKLADEKHNCWSVCADDAAQIRSKIEEWVALTGGKPVDTGFSAQTIKSAATTFAASQAANVLSKRVNSNVVALYLFKEGSGTVVRDLSGVAPAMDLTLSGTEWVAQQGLKNVTGKAEANVESSKKLFDQIAAPNATKEYSIEAWIVPDNNTQAGPARIVSYSIDTGSRNFQLSQNTTQYIHRNRSTAAGISVTAGTPDLATAAGSLKLAPQHVVATFDQTAGRKIYLDGVDTGLADPQGKGDLAIWDPGYSFILGNEKTNDRLWKGVFYLVAIYNRPLSAAQVKQNFDAGYMDRSVLRFDISAAAGMVGGTIELDAGEIDKAGYLFAHPTYIGPNPGSLHIKGMQIAINEVLPAAGQAYRNVDMVVNAPKLELSSMGTVMGQDKGTGSDSFILTFEELGVLSNVLPEPAPAELSMTTDTRAVIPKSGVRTFDQVNNTMSALTGISVTTANVNTVFTQLRQQLPSGSNVMSFLPAQQVGIAKLATEYCDSLVENATARAAFFNTTPAFEFGSPVATAFSTQVKKDLITNTLNNKMIGVNFANQPTATESYTEVNTLINDLVAAANVAVPPLTIDQVRTRSIVKGACTTVLSSAALMVH